MRTQSTGIGGGMDGRGGSAMALERSCEDRLVGIVPESFGGGTMDMPAC